MPGTIEQHADFESVESVSAALDRVGYVSTAEISTVVFLAARMNKPLLVEGPAGVGKTAIAAALNSICGAPLIRLQCYEGLDEAKALYEWEYAKQLLYTQMLREKIGETISQTTNLHEAMESLADEEAVFFHERFLLARPLLAAIRSDVGSVLLIDEVDKSDPEFEAFLLELLSDFQVTVPELGTFHAEVRPVVVLTSNRARELSEALKRRCLHLYIDFPDPARERRIVAKHIPDVTDELNRQLVAFVNGLRELDLRKVPSISESVDWARALLVLNADALDADLVRDTLGVLVKYQEDADIVAPRIPEILREVANAG